ncbi:MAG TPA: asparaginase, partial [Ideonella sp.]|nr:asparaginase [Ideonella sp.]
ALVALGARGLVVEGTGNGTVHHALEAALVHAADAGVKLLRATRCSGGGVVGAPAGSLPSAGELTPAKARIELMLRLLAGG